MAPSIEGDLGRGSCIAYYTYLCDEKGQIKNLNLDEGQIDIITIGQTAWVLHSSVVPFSIGRVDWYYFVRVLLIRLCPKWNFKDKFFLRSEGL